MDVPDNGTRTRIGGVKMAEETSATVTKSETSAPTENAAMEAARAEGAAEVHTGQAAEAAQEAKLAAEAATQAALDNARTAGDVAEAREVAEQSAEVAAVSAERVYAAIQAQGEQLAALTELMTPKEPEKPELPPEEDKTPEKSPKGTAPKKKGGFYYRRLGRGK